MAVYDSIGNYILFQTGSLNPTRTWSRAETSGRDVSAPLVHEKLKYLVLKNPPSTVSGTTSTLTAAYTVVIGRATYAIDPAIYEYLVSYLAVDPAYSLTDLRERITYVRGILEIPAALSVQLAPVPISQYRKRYSYLTAETMPQRSNLVQKFGYPYSVGITINAHPLKWVIETYGPQYLDPTLYGDLADLIQYQKAQFLYIAKNSACELEAKIRNLYPGKQSDRFGSTLLSTKNLKDFMDGNKTHYLPMIVYFSAGSNRASGGLYRPKAGILLGVDLNLPHLPLPIFDDLEANSELLFIPIETALDQIQNNNYPVGSGVNLQFTDGSSIISYAQVQKKIAQLGLNVLPNLKSVS